MFSLTPRFKALVQVCSNSLDDRQIRETLPKPWFQISPRRSQSTLCNLSPFTNSQKPFKAAVVKQNDHGYCNFCQVQKVTESIPYPNTLPFSFIRSLRACHFTSQGMLLTKTRYLLFTCPQGSKRPPPPLFWGLSFLLELDSCFPFPFTAPSLCNEIKRV